MTTEADTLLVPDDLADEDFELKIHRICGACYPDVIKYERPDFKKIRAVCGFKPLGLLPTPGAEWCEECKQLWPDHRLKHIADGWPM